MPQIPLMRYKHMSASRPRRHRLTDVDEVDFEVVEASGRRLFHFLIHHTPIFGFTLVGLVIRGALFSPS